MSLTRPKLPENRPHNPEADFRLRGLKGLQPEQIVQLQDPLFAEREPMHWVTWGLVVAAAANNSKGGIYCLGDPTLIWIVDDYQFSVATAASDVSVRVTLAQGTGVLQVFTTDGLIFLRNRTISDTGAGKAPGNRIVDNSAVNPATIIDRVQQGAANAPSPVIPLGYRLFLNDVLTVFNETVNDNLRFRMRGRVMRR